MFRTRNDKSTQSVPVGQISSVLLRRRRADAKIRSKIACAENPFFLDGSS
jgi:hypothetical protein